MNDQPDPSSPSDSPAPTSNPAPQESNPRGALSEPLPTPWLTYAICALCVVIFGYLNWELKSGGSGNAFDFLVPKTVSIWHGAYWGLITPAFVHLAFWHLFFNLWLAKDLGQVLEPTMGPLKYLAFVVGSAAASHGTELAFSGQTGIGYSGVVYSLFGYALAQRHVQPVYHKITDRKTVQWLLGWAVLCVVLTLAGVWHVANAAHIGGLIFGYCAGAVMVARRFRVVYGIGLGAVACLAILSAVYAPWSRTWNDRTAIHAFVLLIDQAKAGDPSAQFQYGHVLLRFEDRKQEGLEWLKKSAQQQFVPAMNGLAWVFSTSTNAAMRNGTEAVKWARAACAKDGWKEANLVDTLAAAHAELNQWDEAVENQRKAISLLSSGQKKDTNLLGGFEARLRQYQNQEKFRE